LCKAVDISFKQTLTVVLLDVLYLVCDNMSFEMWAEDFLCPSHNIGLDWTGWELM